MNSKFWFLLIIGCLSSTLSSYSQHYKLFFNSKGKPIAAKVLIDSETQRIELNIEGQDIWKFTGKEKNVQIFYDEDDFNRYTDSEPDYDLELIEPGVKPEGDMIRDAAFSPDGSLFAVIYQHSGNIYFYDSHTFEVLNIQDVGDGPIDISLTTDKAYVCCLYSRELYILSLTDFAIIDVLEFSDKPSQIEVSPDGSIFYIGFPTYMNGFVSAYSADTHEFLYEITSAFIHHYGLYGNTGRVFYRYYRFSISPDGNYLVCSNDQGLPAIYNALNGQESFVFDDCGFIAYNASITGDTLFILSCTDELATLYRLNASDLKKIDSITRPVDMFLGPGDLAVSSDGQRVLTQDTWNEVDILFDFSTMSTMEFPANILFEQSVFNSFDREYAICQSDLSLEIFDMDNPGFISSINDWIGYFGAAFPGEYKFLYPLNIDFFQNTYYKDEKFCIADFQNPSSIIIDTCIVAGSLPEADLTNSACLSGDGQKIISANFLSGNVSVIDRANHMLEDLFELDNVLRVTAVPESNYVLLSGFYSPHTYLFNVENNVIEQEIPVSSPWAVNVSFDGEYAYINDNSGMLFKVVLDGSNTHVAGYFPVYFHGSQFHIGGGYHEFFLTTKPGLSPDGELLLVSRIYNVPGPEMQLINTETMQIVKVLSLNDEATYDIAFTSDSKRACIISCTNIAQIIYLDGANSFVESNIVSVSGKFFSAAYNPITGNFLLGSNGRMDEVEPPTGAIIGSSYYPNEYLLQIAVDLDGIPMIRSERKFFHGQDSYDLPGVSEWFAYDSGLQMVVIPIPGPDMICLFDPMQTEMTEIPATGSKSFTIWPNPTNEYLNISTIDLINEIEVFDNTGKLVYQQKPSAVQFSLNVKDLMNGMYLMKVSQKGKVCTAKFLVNH
jgi:DNA-binding beta-propeller fold protein YncE